MCGINGLNYPDQSQIEIMNAAIKHRGPDDQGVFVNEHVSLGHVRLSILDLSPRGHQPMANKSQTLWIVFNGEIYNFKDIRKKLQAQGFQFQSDTDTEVILYAFEAWGIESFNEFNGIFAFCLYDTTNQKLYLVRDRLGIKPLYYYFANRKFFFSSEIKTFQKISDLKLTLDPKAIEEFKTTNNIYKEGFFNEISAMPSGSFISFDINSQILKTEQYCPIENDIGIEKYETLRTKPKKSLIDELDQLLNQIVKDQLISDAPLGTICSGGLDSSLITAIASRYKKDIKLFNVRVENSTCDESKYAHQVAAYLKLDLIEEVLNQDTFVKRYKDCLFYGDVPMLHPNSVGIYLISQKAKKEGFSALLSGEGADELFGGYHHYKAFSKRTLLKRIPLASRILKNHPLFKDLELLGCDNQDSRIVNERCLDSPWLRTRYEITKKFFNKYNFIENNHERAVKSFIAKDLQYYLIAILRRTDRMSMATGLEMRVPYLDNRLITFALNLPVKYQITLKESKILLKEIALRYLPKDIVYRAKKGFPLPVTDWLGTKDWKELFLNDWKMLNKL